MSLPAHTSTALTPVVLLVPTRNEVGNVAHVAELVAACLAEGIVDRAVVLDGQSDDGTTAAALAAGLEVMPLQADPDDPIEGKGDAVWRAAGTLEAGIVVLIDADVKGISPAGIADLVATVHNGAVLAKGSFTRLQSHDEQVRPIGGRITEFLVKPLLRTLRPALGHVTEPLSGQLAIRGDVLRAIPLATGYGLEISMLLAVAQRHGDAAIVDVPLGQITHHEKTDARLVAMADEVAATLTDRLPVQLGAEASPVPTDRRLTAHVRLRAPAGGAEPSPGWLPLDRLSVMGIVNVNADSFSDSREDFDLAERIAFARGLMDDGADLLDLGTQSARTDLPPEDERLESERLEVVLAELAGVPTSIDTYKTAVAATALAHGATIINDYSGLSEPDLAGIVADAGAWYVLTHNRGKPKERLTDAGRYDDVMVDVIAFFTERLAQCEAAGLHADRIMLDPGIDLSKTPAQSVEVLRRLPELRAAFGLPHLVAVSRKDFLGAALGRLPRQRDAGMLATLPALAALSRTIVRVHDVRATRDHLHVTDLMAGRAELGAAAEMSTDVFYEPPT